MENMGYGISMRSSPSSHKIFESIEKLRIDSQYYKNNIYLA
jgi:hypothetical protein